MRILQDKNQWRLRINVETGKLGLIWKMAIKMVCVYRNDVDDFSSIV